ncbi:glycosyltransferase [Streptococcus suis]|nr:glycosyltransferase [Streptococcus suis]
MIKLLFTINYVTNGGPSRVLLNIINNLDRSIFDIYVLTIIDSNEKVIIRDLENKNVRVISFNIEKNLKSFFSSKNQIVEKIEEIKPDIIHTHGIVTTFLVSRIKGKTGKITTIHNNIFEDYTFTYGKVKGFILAIINLIILKNFNKVISCSETSYNQIKRVLKNSTFIRNGIDFINTSSIDIRKAYSIPQNAIVYMYCGVINSRKRVYDLVENLLPLLLDNEFLLIVGDGDKNIVNSIKSISNEKVIFAGFQTNIVDYLNSSDIYVSYSASEGFSISVIEALSQNLYCFLSDIESHKECFEIDKKYYIGETFNLENIEEKKSKLNQEFKSKKERDIDEFQRQYLSGRVMTDEYVKIYKEICKGNN